MIGAMIGGGTGSAAGAGTTNDDRQDGWTWQQDCHTDYYTHTQYWLLTAHPRLGPVSALAGTGPSRFMPLHLRKHLRPWNRNRLR
ncbi:hypothetical protein GL305_01030 [Nocardia seriolae]|uniref:hypothetical protein n=1 Tax=Nocardia seriolae TaxID=37332 RepID=UPI0012BC22DE|nr:hypothetical protein [Nocardia seriolae]MTK28638.1 hypothetical protein [Nocardia seriolae]